MKYEVTLARKVYGSIVVEADNALDAEDKVQERLQFGNTPPEMDESYEPSDWEVLDTGKIDEDDQ